MQCLVDLRAACRAGRLDEVRAAVVFAAGVHGHLTVCQWAVAEHGMDLHGWAGIRMFCSACEYGHLHVCQWLTVSHGFEPHDWHIVFGAAHDARVGVMDRGFQHAVARRHWAIARWLVQRRPAHPWPAEALFELERAGEALR
jgi:hypothetical protein